MEKKGILKHGDTVGLIAPAGVITNEKLKNSIENIKKLGLNPFYFDSILEQKGYLAGNDHRRTDELHKMYESKDVKAILCVRGGYGSTRILDLLDYALIKKNPKPLIGYSDITALHSAIYLKTGQIGFHGILGAELFSEYSVENFRQFFFENSERITIKSNGVYGDHAYTITPGNVTGITICGNLSLLTSLIGTKYDCDWKGKIIFIEEVNEAPYKIDRMLTQLIMANKFNQVKGVVFGRFSKCEPEHFGLNSSESFKIKEVLFEKIQPLKIPASYGFSFGHIKDQAILPFGAYVDFNSDNFQISFKREEFKEFL